MATVVLQYAGAALGSLLGPIGGMIGRAVGGIVGNVVDQQLFGTSTHHEGPRLNGLRVMASEEGAPIPTVFGRMRISGQVIWASNLIETATTTTQSAAGKGGVMGGGSTDTSYAYFANFAVGLCEGEISGLGRAWADGKEIDLEAFSPRLYLGTETQNPDSLITATEGTSNAPAYRGLAYVVFERLPLASFGNRLPQFSFEVIAKGSSVADKVKAVSLIPGSTEFGYDTTLVSRTQSAGVTVSENAHVSATQSDWSVAVDQLQASCGNAEAASLVVAWFGNDLRCGQCQIKPGVDSASKMTSPYDWQVSGISRSAARVVSEVNGQPAFGGTPSDASVIRAIQDLRARGLKVMFYPFILMDIPAGNGLTDPYGGTAQATFPWRGRMTASIAPGRAGTPDKTSAAATQISSFIGAATPSQFSASSTTVTYSGPAEWSFRRMILHYAKLCALAGGVDAFLLGSELVGLTTLRGAGNSFPFVAALQTLAAEVKAILPDAKISYGADWSEYFGHQPQDGSDDVYFHLDPLWSSSSIDFVGVDNYVPLSDWRDGTSHLDFQAGTRSIYDQAYLQARMASGENYDWYYASANDRDNQLRTPITDGAYGKPWVFRPKDFKNWWSNPHYNRPAGIQAATPTGWVPQSKPIWFTEAGCPAIDKGTNTPNAFYDAKSTESALPAYSGGQQDVQMQHAYVRAVQDYWTAAGSGNPVSAVYGAPMVAANRIFYWAWDARPFPAFPTRSDVWSDGENYAKGHWLNGRIGAAAIGDVIAALAARFGLTDINVSEVEGLVDGFVLDRPMSARDALEGLLQGFGIDAVESEGKIKFRNRRTLQPVVIDAGDLVEEAGDTPIFQQTRTQETELAASVRMTYAESGLDYRNATVSRTRGSGNSARQIAINVPVTMSQAQAQMRVDVALEEAWAARETAHFTLPPHAQAVEAGDVLKLGTGQWRVKSIALGTAAKIEAVAHDPAVYEAPPAQERLSAATAPHIYGQPDAQMFDLAWLGPQDSAAPWVAAQAAPWPGTLALMKKTGAASFVFNAALGQQATLGKTLSVWPAGAPHRIDYTAALDVELSYGALASVSVDEVLSGANLAAIGMPDTGYELVQFLKADLIGPNQYRLNGFLRGQGGSEAEMLASRAAGQNFILLNAAVVQPELAASETSLPLNWRLGPAQLDYGNPAYLDLTSPTGLRALRPLRPAHLKMTATSGGWTVSWIRRTRMDGDSWDFVDVPLGEDSESYQVDIYAGGTLKRSLTTNTQSLLYTTSNFATDFTSAPAAITVKVAQRSAIFGAGDFSERTFNV
ncbi:MAG: glycoside hydrolase/phage tail family protein [Alphaproteobacteria bacterium]|nr:glycoside hydrolase/phage tail family protein [Alphaproteobacteria bacterium]